MAERADPFIKSIDIADEDGRLIPEHDKDDPNLSRLEDRIEYVKDEKNVGDSTEPVDMTGKGYKRHREAYGDTMPTRKVIKVLKSEE